VVWVDMSEQDTGTFNQLFNVANHVKDEDDGGVLILGLKTYGRYVCEPERDAAAEDRDQAGVRWPDMTADSLFSDGVRER